MKVTGRHGLDLHEHWKGDARAYLDITIPGLRHARERRDLQAAVDTCLTYGRTLRNGRPSWVRAQAWRSDARCAMA